MDDVETVEFGELYVFLGKAFVVTARHAESPDLISAWAAILFAPTLVGTIYGTNSAPNRAGWSVSRRPAADPLPARRCWTARDHPLTM